MVAESFDVVIVGGGPVGMALALRLREWNIATLLLEAQPLLTNPVTDSRPLALSYGSQLILKRLDVWDNLVSVTPIQTIHISNHGHAGQTLIQSEDAGVPVLGSVVNYHGLYDALYQMMRQQNVTFQLGAKVTSLIHQPDHVQVDYEQSGETHRVDAKLLVLADGGKLVSQVEGIHFHTHDYQQWAVVANIQTSIDQRGIAYEHFTLDGPVALLPSGTGYALVWTVPAEQVDRILNWDDATFLSELQVHFGDMAGKFVSCGKRTGFPLTLKYASPTIAPRTVLIGNASQTLHPVAGQGFNLGLRDAWELASELIRSANFSADLGSSRLLSSFASKRQIDREGGKFFTNTLAKLFTVDLTSLQVACGLGLSVLDQLSPVKRFVARRMIFGARG
ncbi:MAG TPA: FAD-dependent monooxygenase [Nitrosomonas sp.]|nr:FAD-dependent monooxygenase [Nitrosomonas sp.]